MFRNLLRWIEKVARIPPEPSLEFAITPVIRIVDQGETILTLDRDGTLVADWRKCEKALPRLNDQPNNDFYLVQLALAARDDGIKYCHAHLCAVTPTSG